MTTTNCPHRKKEEGKKEEKKEEKKKEKQKSKIKMENGHKEVINEMKSKWSK